MKKLFLLITLVAGIIAFALPAQATTLTFDLDYEFSGATPPAGSTPWITATFDDSYGGANTVRLTMSAGNLTGVEFIDDWLFNFDDTLDVTHLIFAAIDTSYSTPNHINTGMDAFKADGDGFFDIEFDFPPPPGHFNSKFTTGETVIYDITYTSSIDVNSFDHYSAPGGGAGVYLSAAHIQGIDPDGDESGWIGPENGGVGGGGIPIPEPATILLVGSGLLGFGLRARKKFRK